MDDGKTIGIDKEAPYIEVKRQAAKAQLGIKWLLHPDHQVKRDDSKTIVPRYLQNQVLIK